MDDVDHVLTRIGELEGVDFAFCIDRDGMLLGATRRPPRCDTLLLAHRARDLDVQKLFRGECIVVESDEAAALPRLEIHPIARRAVLVVAVRHAGRGSPPDGEIAQQAEGLVHAVRHLREWTARDFDELFTSR